MDLEFLVDNHSHKGETIPRGKILAIGEPDASWLIAAKVCKLADPKGDLPKGTGRSSFKFKEPSHVLGNKE